MGVQLEVQHGTLRCKKYCPSQLTPHQTKATLELSFVALAFAFLDNVGAVIGSFDCLALQHITLVLAWRK
eukprot:3691695-Amphidinium_carterae.1